MDQPLEGAREWETLKYDSLLIPNTVVNDVNSPIPRDALTSCSDTGLTAFAQLAALRLNTTRALISLFDRQYQYIVAEATQNVPLCANTTHAADQLWLCGTAVPRSFGICEHVLHGPPTELSDNARSSPLWSSQAELHVSVVPDLAEDPRFSDRPYIHAAPHNRFYAGVPIRSPKGFNIGVLCVFDENPRSDGLDTPASQFLVDLSGTIMGYIDSRRVNDSYLRSERMVLGLGNFIQGRDEPSTWWAKKDPHPSRVGPQDREVSVEPTANDDGVHPPETETGVDKDEPVRPGINPISQRASFGLNKGGSTDSVKTTTTSSQSSSTITPLDPHQAEVIKIFHKAADIIRESLDVDGAIFLDAAVGSFGGLVGPSHHHRSSHGTDDPTSSSEDSSSGNPKARDDERPCNIFAVSRLDKTSKDHNRPETDSIVVTERFLKKLLRRYPNGKVFSFDEAGTWYSGESSGSSGDDVTEAEEKERGTKLRTSRALSPYSRRNEARTISHLFPDARSIALVPLWDPYRDRWQAGGFVWSKTPARILTTNADLPYLRAFGMVTMAELTRLDAVIADKAKTDILGSLSHELRSPLHGVVAAAELLHDTQLDLFQVDVVHTIEISGKTLLDTIDHLLAYSKINTFLRSSKSQRRNNNKAARGLREEGQASIESGMMTLVSNVSLDVLAEEVIESVFIGHSFQHMVASQLARHGAKGPISSAQEKLDTIYSADIASSQDDPNSLPTNIGDVQVIINIDPSRHWMFHTQSGAIRRIIMNLFGNALKYTSRGHVKISLHQLEDPHKTPRNHSTVVLTVADTGKGISEDFLQNKLFTPFSQEDHLAPGTGLGLSLVRQIVVSLGGSINVKSHVNQGTTVTVSIPLVFAQKQDGHPTRDQRPSFDRSALKSVRVSAIGFINDSSFDREFPNGPRIPSMESLPLKWYNIALCEPFERDGEAEVAPDADVVIYSEAAYSKMDRATREQHSVPAVVVCHNASNTMRLDAALRHSSSNAVFEFVHQPITPRKFGKAVSYALTRWKELQDSKKLLDPGLSSSSEGSSAGTDSTTSVPLSPDSEEMSSSGADIKELMAPAPCRRVWDLETDSRGLRSPPASPLEAGDFEGKTCYDGASLYGLGPALDAEPHTELGPPVEKIVEGSETVQTNGGGERSRSRSRSHFLVVDDNPINLKLLCTFMKRLGRQHCTAMNGLQAFEAFAQCPEQFCCILMDINMPIMDGLESTRQIRQFEREHQLEPVTVIAITGLGSHSAREEAFASGLDLFLTRPVRMKELSTILKELGLGEKATATQLEDKDKDTVPAGTISLAVPSS